LTQKVLVTGGTGFLGAYILQALVEKGYAVRAIHRSSNYPDFIDASINRNVEWVEGDILDVVSLEDAMKGIDIVVHAAALVSFYKSDKKKLFKINVDGTANVVNMAIENGIKKMYYISSVAALGRTSYGEKVTEEKKWTNAKTNTNYAISKYYAEREVWRGMGEGMDVVILNPSTIIGYGDWNHSSCKIFKTVYEEFPWYTEGVNGFVFVEDVAKVLLEIMQTDTKNERFIVNGDNYTFQNLFNEIATAFGKKKPTKKATRLMGVIAAYVEKVKSLFNNRKPLLTLETAKVAQSKTYFDNSKILKVLPDFRFTPLQNAIEISAKKYLQNLK
jgi:dihydroflavonol-4-reductase